MPTDMKQAGVSILIACSALAISACGGGSSSSSDNSATALTPGVYNIGRVYEDRETLEGISLFSSSGKFVAQLGRVDFGTLTFSNSGRFSIEIEEYLLGDFSGPVSGALKGQVVSAKEANLTASKSGSDPISNGVLYRDDKRSDSGVTFDDELFNSFTTSDAEGAKTITINPDSSDDSKGVLDGNIGNKCKLSGDVSIPDKSINVFEVSYKATGCEPSPKEQTEESARNGDYTGLGTYIPSKGEILIYSQNGTVAWKFRGKR